MLIYSRAAFVIILVLIGFSPAQSQTMLSSTSNKFSPPLDRMGTFEISEDGTLLPQFLKPVQQAPAHHELTSDSSHSGILTTGKADQHPVISWTVEDALENLLLYNPDISKAQLQWQTTLDRHTAAYGAFEPALFGKVKHEVSQRPSSLAKQMENTYNGGIEGLLPTSTKYSLNFSLTDIRNRFSDNTSSPSTFMGLTLTQPLLRGLWAGKSSVEIKSAQIESKISFHKYRSTLFSKIFELELAYWKLLYNQKQVEFTRASVDIAEEIVKDSRIQLRAQKISQLEAVEASAGLASRKTKLVDARKELTSSMNELKLLIAGRMYLVDTLIQASSKLNSDYLDSSLHLQYDSDIEIKDIQPDFLQKKYELEKQNLICDYQSKQCLPDLNIKSSFGYVVSARMTGLAWEKFMDYEYRSRSGIYSAEVEFRLPLGMNVKERNLLKAEKKNLQSAEINLQTAQTQIANYLEASYKRLEDLRSSFGNAQIVIEYRTDLLEAEIAKQKAGKSNYRKIFELEEELTKSKKWRMEIIIDAKSLRAQMARLEGFLLLEKDLERFEDGRPVLNDLLVDGFGQGSFSDP